MRYETENQCQGTDAKPEPAKPRSGEAPGSAIYVIVHVSYDYYRFQDNEGATTCLDEARKLAESTAVLRGYENEPLPIIESADESRRQDDSEQRHIWIERWPNMKGQP